MYLSCIGIVALWIGCGTLFYSYHNEWPLAQSFFYAVDAGMSIGFCTEVAETTVSSRAFTIIFIILGASVVGGALALFVQEAVAGAASAGSAEYRRLLERDAFRRADTDQDGVLNYDEFGALIRWCGYELGEAEMLGLCRKFDASGDGIISYREFMRSFRGLQALLDTSSALYARSPTIRAAARAWATVRAVTCGEHRIFAACAAWVALGVAWGVAKQRWDVITATHFAVSALATGGLTAPPVDPVSGVMPRGDALFTGFYCLLGIPLFALTLGHFALVLVEGHVVAAERRAIAALLRPEEFALARSLCSGSGERVHLSDFVLVHLLRQGKVGIETLGLLKRQFSALDRDGSGTLTLAEATAPLEPFVLPPPHGANSTATKV